MGHQDAVKILLWFGESIGFWIQTGAFLLSALAAVWVVHHNGAMAKRRATIDHIIHQKSNQALLDAIHIVYKLHEDKAQFTNFLSHPDSDECKAILKLLNNHEFIALGIRRNAFEERIYKELQFSNFMKVYNSAAGIIGEIRKAAPMAFQEFEWLIKRWEKNPLKKHT